MESGVTFEPVWVSSPALLSQTVCPYPCGHPLTFVDVGTDDELHRP